MGKPIRIQKEQEHKQVSPNGLPIVYVGRPTFWGNPYKIGDAGVYDADAAVICYKAYLKVHPTGIIVAAAAKQELKGKNLSCWCKENESCHADYLLEIANK